MRSYVNSEFVTQAVLKGDNDGADSYDQGTEVFVGCPAHDRKKKDWRFSGIIEYVKIWQTLDVPQYRHESIVINQEIIRPMSAEEIAIKELVDQMWDIYDVDNSGSLDKEETKRFVRDILGNLGS